MGDDGEMGSFFDNPVFLMHENHYVKLVIDARYPNSRTGLKNYAWPWEAVQMVMTRVNGEFLLVSELR